MFTTANGASSYHTNANPFKRTALTPVASNGIQTTLYAPIANEPLVSSRTLSMPDCPTGKASTQHKPASFNAYNFPLSFSLSLQQIALPPATRVSLWLWLRQTGDGTCSSSTWETVASRTFHLCFLHEWDGRANLHRTRWQSILQCMLWQTVQLVGPDWQMFCFFPPLPRFSLKAYCIGYRKKKKRCNWVLYSVFRMKGVWRDLRQVVPRTQTYGTMYSCPIFLPADVGGYFSPFFRRKVI